MPIKPFPAKKEDYDAATRKRLQKFIKDADVAVAKKGRYLWFTDRMKLICRSNHPKQAKAQAMRYFEEHDLKKGWNDRWVVEVEFRAWKKWIDIFDKDRGPLEIQAIRLKIQEHPSPRKKYSFGDTLDGRSLIRMFYHPDEAHRFKLMHLKHMGKAALNGDYATKIVTTYNAKDFPFIK